MRKYLLAGMALVSAVAAAPSSATVVLVDASSIQGANVLFNSGVQTGTEVFGNTNNGIATLRFTGGTVGGGTILRANGGQARVEGALDASTQNPNDTLLVSSLQFGLINQATFNNLEFNLFGGTATSATFNITDNEGQLFTFANRALGNGENFFGFQGINGETIRNVSITFNGGGVGDIRQIRLDALAGAGPIPEPATWAMMVGGFGLLGAAARRRSHTTSVTA
jgi:hypothetical protein